MFPGCPMNHIARLPDWPERLSDAIKAASGRPFSWGAHDCALFAADCALAVTGIDPLEPVRGAYASERGAMRVLRRLGCEDVEQLADLVIGARVPLALARRGDWVAIREPGIRDRGSDDGPSPGPYPLTSGPALGVCLGAQAAFLQENGLTFRRTLACAAAWKIGD